MKIIQKLKSKELKNILKNTNILKKKSKKQQ